MQSAQEIVLHFIKRQFLPCGIDIIPVADGALVVSETGESMIFFYDAQTGDICDSRNHPAAYARWRSCARL